jgi:hypothetical protein
MPNNEYWVKTILCPHCQQTMYVHIRALRGGSAGTSAQEVSCAQCGKLFHVTDVPPIISGPFLPESGLEAEIMKQMEKNEGHATVDHLTHVLKVPRADVDAALHKLKVQGHLREGELFGRDLPVGK